MGVDSNHTITAYHVVTSFQPRARQLKAKNLFNGQRQNDLEKILICLSLVYI